MGAQPYPALTPEAVNSLLDAYLEMRELVSEDDLSRTIVVSRPRRALAGPRCDVRGPIVAGCTGDY